jgi:hypothetical protein
MSRETVIRRIVKREIQRCALTEQAVCREALSLYRMACKEFGTWDTALKYAGVGIRRVYAKEEYTSDRVLEILREYCEGGQKLKASDLMRHDRRLYDAARRHFGTWRQVRMMVAPNDAANTGPRRGYRKWSPDVVIEQICRRQREGKPLSYTAVQREQGTLIYAAKKHFGSWQRALAAVGVAMKARRRKQA